MMKTLVKGKIKVRLIATVLALVTLVTAFPANAGAMTMDTPYGEKWTITKGYNLPLKVISKQSAAGGNVVFHPSKKNYLNINYHILPGSMCGLTTKENEKKYASYSKKVLENVYNDIFVVWPVKKDYKGGIPKRAEYLAKLSGERCWYYPGYANKLELFAPDELERKVIEILKSRGFWYAPDKDKIRYENGIITKKEYKDFSFADYGSWTEVAYPVNLKSDENPEAWLGWDLKNRHSVDAYAKDLADAIEKHKLGSFKTLEEYKAYKMKLYKVTEEKYEGQYAPSFDLNYCGIWSEVTGFGRKEVGGKWISKFNEISVRYVWKIY